jgi:hypothetical protein
MRAIAVALVLAGCGHPVELTPVSFSGTCAGQVQALVDNNLQDPNDPVPVGTRVEVRCTVNGAVVAWGSGRTPVAVPLWTVGSFVPLGATPLATRAGHTATKLADGTVFVAGGYRNLGDGATALGSAELYAPDAFAFEDLPSMAVAGGVALPRAFHSAVVAGNQVWLQGGEFYRPDETVELSSTVVFDGPSRKYGVLAEESIDIPRSHALALSDGHQTVFVLGGEHAGAPVSDVETLDVLAGTMKVVPSASLPLGAAAGAWFPAVGLAAVDSSGAVTYLTASGAKGSDASGVSAPVTAAFGHGTQLLVAGESGAGLLDVQSHQTAVGPDLQVAQGSCTVALGDNAWVIIGGRAQGLSWSNGAWSTRGFDPVPTPRTEHTCTLLDDHTVLMLGGRDGDGKTLGDAWRFVPPIDWR